MTIDNPGLHPYWFEGKWRHCIYNCRRLVGWRRLVKPYTGLNANCATWFTSTMVRTKLERKIVNIKFCLGASDALCFTVLIVCGHVAPHVSHTYTHTRLHTRVCVCVCSMADGGSWFASTKVWEPMSPLTFTNMRHWGSMAPRYIQMRRFDCKWRPMKYNYNVLMAGGVVGHTHALVWGQFALS